jgi:hypothetical protein
MPAPITEFDIPTTLGIGGLNIGANPSNINGGKMWTQDIAYGNCYWEAWVRPVYPSLLGYWISDGSGGAHNVLLGLSMGTSNGTFTGNVWNQAAGAVVSLDATADLIPLGDDVHLAFSFDGAHLRLFTNGIVAYSVAYTGTRSYPAGGSDGNVYIGGSYHLNFPGIVFRVRGVEGSACGMTANNPNVPRDFGPYVVNRDGSTQTRCSFAQDYSTEQRVYADYGVGFESRIHHGIYSRFDNTTPFPVFNGVGDVVPSAFVPSAGSVPSGAVVYDSFGRANRLQTFDNNATLGSTEGGSAGVLLWKTNFPTVANAGVGILYGKAVFTGLGNTSIAWVESGLKNVDIRVTKPASSFVGTGIFARYKDANDYWAITGNDTLISFEKMESGVQTFPSGITVPSGWSELKVVCVNTTMTIYTDGVSRGTKTIADLSAATNHGLYNGVDVFRASDFTIFSA